MNLFFCLSLESNLGSDKEIFNIVIYITSSASVLLCKSDNFRSFVGMCVFFYFRTFLHFPNLYHTSQCTVRKLIDTIEVFAQVSFTTEPVFPALIRLKLSISRLLQHYEQCTSQFFALVRLTKKYIKISVPCKKGHRL